MEIQEIRDYYKLSITLQSRSPRIDKTKDRLLIRATREIENIKTKIDKGMIDYGKENTANRQKKLTNIVEEYKEEFQKHIRRRGISL